MTCGSVPQVKKTQCHRVNPTRLQARRIDRGNCHKSNAAPLNQPLRHGVPLGAVSQCHPLTCCRLRWRCARSRNLQNLRLNHRVSLDTLCIQGYSSAFGVHSGSAVAARSSFLNCELGVFVNNHFQRSVLKQSREKCPRGKYPHGTHPCGKYPRGKYPRETYQRENDPCEKTSARNKSARNISADISA